MLLNTLRWQGFGDYEVIEEIDRGGMGVVYRARQRSLEREVALKMILAGELAGKKALRMFQTEAQAAANLHHPNIVPVYEIGEHEMQNYFTMRYIPGGLTVADWAASHRGDSREIAAVVAKISRAVAHAHERGVLHCDLKPSNVLWDPRGEPMVTDFGLAKLLDRSDPAVTYTAAIAGSPSYMAPEQFDGKAGSITTATDIYGIGSLLYEMLSGRPPFDGGSPLEILRKVSQESPRALLSLPKDLEVICMKCLEKRPEDRYSSAAALADDLEHFVRGEPVSAVPLTWTQGVWRWALRKPRSAALLTLCAISILFGMTGIIMQWMATQRANRVQAEALERVRWQEIERWQEDGNVSQALSYLANLVRQRPSHWQAAMYAMSIVNQTSIAVPAGPNIIPPANSTASARLSSDGRWIFTAGSDACVRLWETSSGKEARHIQMQSLVTELATGSLVPLALATQNGEIAVLPKLDGELFTLSRTVSLPAKKLSFSANGRLLVAMTESKLEVWSVKSLSAAPQSLDLEEDMKGMMISADGLHVLGWGKTKACIWDTAAFEKRLNIRANEVFYNAALSADGQKLAIIDGFHHVRIWSISQGVEENIVESPLSSFNQVCLSGDGSRLTMAGNGNDLWFYDTKSGLPVNVATRHHYNVRNLVTDSQGKYVYSYGNDDSMCVADAVTGDSVIGSVQIGHVQDEADIHPSNDGRIILAHSRVKMPFHETISVWQGTNRMHPIRHRVAGERDFHFSRLSPDGRLGCLGLYPGDRCYVYELSSGHVLLDKKTNGNVYVTLFSPDMTKCYAMTANGWIHGWSMATGEELWPPNNQPGKIRPAVITSDGTRIIVGHNDGHIRIYNTETGQVMQVLDHPGEIKTLRLAPGGGEVLLSGSTNKLAHTWDLRTGKKLQTFEGHSHTIIASGWSPGGRYVATASYDRTARIWDVITGKSVGSPMKHQAWLSHLEFSPDGRTVATACRDGTARLWEAKTGKPASQWMEQGSTCETVRFTNDGAALLIRDHGGFRFWDTERAEPITIHYKEPVSGGLGMDSESHRSIMREDGSQVFLASSMNYGALWEVPQPRASAPSWFPDFIEALAGLNFGNPEEANHVRARWLPLKTKLLESTDPGVFSVWARKTLSINPE
ncbi:protein kinase domain-containing protein [Prosthecobacter fusiformis]|nr:protein kinase [Prosthecobacter fusiformis]